MLAWIDLETTGLDPDKDDLLEVALVVTDNELCEVEVAQYVIECRRDPSTVDKVVREMHEKNGLWEQVAGAELGVVVPVSLELAEQSLLRVLRRHVEPRTTPMAGSTIAFDRVFLRKYMPKFERHFSHRSVDVSSLGELALRWNYGIWNDRPRGDERHRALPDVRHSIELLRYWRNNLFCKGE